MRFVGIDPSTKTGFVALDGNGNVLKAKEITGVGSVDPKRIVTLTRDIAEHIHPDDFICIEGIPFDTQRAAQAGWIHGSIRNALYIKKIHYYEAAPNAVKKFVAVTGWVGEVGSKRRLKGPEKKRAVKEAVLKHYGFTHQSDNIIDAYIMAHIARVLYLELNGITVYGRPSYQDEVIHSILEPPKKKAK